MLVGAGGGGGIVDGAWAVICGAEAAIERVTRTDWSGVAVDCDDATGRVDADGGDEAAGGTRAAIGGARAVAERVTCLVGTGCSSSSLLLEKSVGDSVTGSTDG